MLTVASTVIATDADTLILMLLIVFIAAANSDDSI